MAINNYVVKTASLTDIGLKRSLNEDSVGFIEINDGYVYIVCDGMGGHEGGEIASKAAVRFIIESLKANPIENPTIAILQAISFANQQIYITALNRPELKGMGTTVAVLLIYKDEIYTAHVGDSRIYALSDGQFFQITKDHSVVQEMVDKGILHAQEAETHPRKNEITKALGIREEVMPSINNKPIKAKPGDRFIICSDGLSGLISHQIFTKAVVENAVPDICAHELVSLAKKGGGDDNISVQVVDIIQSPFDKSYFPSRPANLPVPKKKMKKSLVIAIIFGGLVILAGIGWGIGKFVFNGLSFIVDSSTSVTSKQNNQEPSNMENVGFISIDSAIQILEAYLIVTNNPKDPNHYKEKLIGSSPTDIEFLKTKKVLDGYDSVKKSYKLHKQIYDKLQNYPGGEASLQDNHTGNPGVYYDDKQQQTKSHSKSTPPAAKPATPPAAKSTPSAPDKSAAAAPAKTGTAALDKPATAALDKPAAVATDKPVAATPAMPAPVAADKPATAAPVKSAGVAPNNPTATAPEKKLAKDSKGKHK